MNVIPESEVTIERLATLFKAAHCIVSIRYSPDGDRQIFLEQGRLLSDVTIVLDQREKMIKVMGVIQIKRPPTAEDLNIFNAQRLLGFGVYYPPHPSIFVLWHNILYTGGILERTVFESVLVFSKNLSECRVDGGGVLSVVENPV